MAFSQVQAVSASPSAGGALNVVISAATLNNLLIVVVGGGGGASIPTFSVADNQGSSYSSCTGSRITSASNNMALETFYALAASGATTISITATGGATFGAAVEEQSGNDTSSPFVDANGASGSGGSADSGAITATGATLVASGVTDNNLFNLTSDSLTKGTGYSDGSNLGSNGSNRVTIGIEHKIGTFSNPHGTWTIAGGIPTWLCNVASFLAAADPAIPRAAVVRELDRPGSVFAGSTLTAISKPFSTGPGAILPISAPEVELSRPGFAGGVFVASGRVPIAPTVPWGSRVLIYVEKPWEIPGGRVIASASRVDRLLPPSSRPIREAARPGEPGSVRVMSGRAPMERPMLPAVVGREAEKPTEPGRVVAFAYPALPTVRIPTGARLVFRELDPGPAPGRASASMARPENFPVPVPRVVARAVDAEPSWFVGSARGTRTFEPPEPFPMPAVRVELPTTLRPEGSVRVVRSIARAEPPGALVPRVIIVRELARPDLANPPGFVRSTMAAQDYTIVIPTPIFESKAPATYRSMATQDYNSKGPESFRARRVP